MVSLYTCKLSIMNKIAAYDAGKIRLGWSRLLKLLGEERGKVTGTDRQDFQPRRWIVESKGSNGPTFAWALNMVFIDMGKAHIGKGPDT